MDQISDKVKLFAKERRGATVLGRWTLLLPPVLFALARSPDFRLKDFFGLVEGTFHNGYVGAYGHFVVVALAVIYGASLSKISRLHRAVCKDLGEAARGEGRNTESLLLEPPFWRDFFATRPRLNIPVPLIPLVVSFVFYAAFIVEYFQFHDAARPRNGIHDLLVGKPDQSGFHGEWDRGMGGTGPWINAPWQTWLGLVGFVVLGWEIWVAWKTIAEFIDRPENNSAAVNGSRGHL